MHIATAIRRDKNADHVLADAEQADKPYRRQHATNTNEPGTAYLTNDTSNHDACACTVPMSPTAIVPSSPTRSLCHRADDIDRYVHARQRHH